MEGLAKLSRLAPTRFDIPERFYIDPRGRYRSFWRALVEPRNTDETHEVLAYASEKAIPVVPYGGGTGLVGGQCYPHEEGAICLSLRRMDDIQIKGESALVGAGVVLDALHEALKGGGMRFPLSLASSGSAQIGGLIATNAGGVNVIRFGNMGALVLGLKAVLGGGQMLDTTRDLHKDNTGPAIERLLIGSEGALGVITRARLKLVPPDLDRLVGLSPIKSPKRAMALLERLRGVSVPINAFELISGVGLRFRDEAGFDPSPIGNPDWSVLFDIAGNADALAPIADDLADAIIAEDARRISELWHIRESIPLANRHMGAVASHDIALPLDQIVDFIEAMNARLDANSDVRINCFGHLGDGNLHYNLFPARGRKREDYDAAALSDLIYHEVAHRGGSIAAEHGIGRYKAPMMARYGLGEKQALIARIKAVMDPDGIMNPGVIVG